MLLLRRNKNILNSKNIKKLVKVTNSSFKYCKYGSCHFSSSSSDNSPKDIPNPSVYTSVWTIPNMITMTRLALSPPLGLLIIYDQSMLAFYGCITLGMSDWLDGYIAKNYNQRSVVGEFLDPLADKILIGIVTCSLSIKSLIPLSLATLIIGRDVVIVSTTFYLRSITKSKASTFFDISDIKISVQPSLMSKLNTASQIILLSTTLSVNALCPTYLYAVEPLWYITTITTLASGMGYLDGKGIEGVDKIKR